MDWETAKKFLEKKKHVTRKAWKANWLGPFVFKYNENLGTGYGYCPKNGRGATISKIVEYKPSGTDLRADDWTLME